MLWLYQIGTASRDTPPAPEQMGLSPTHAPQGSARHSPRKTQTPRFLSDLRWLQHSLLVIPAGALGRVLCHLCP